MSGDERKTARRRRRPKRRSASRDHAEAPPSAPASTAEPARTMTSLTHQRRMALAATITVFGVAMVGMGESNVGAAAVLAGLLAFIWSIHTFGRLGPEALPVVLLAMSLVWAGPARAQPAPAPPPAPTEPAPAPPPSTPSWDAPAESPRDDAEPPAPPEKEPAPATKRKPKRRRPRRPAPYGYAPPPGYGDPRSAYPGYGYPPYGYPPYGYPYGYGAPAQPAPVKPYRDGEAPPDGYHFGTRVRRGMVIGGASTFGGCWVLSIAVGAALQSRSDPDVHGNFLPLLVPLAGPFITIGTSDSGGVGTAVLLLDGAGQALGLGLFVAGLLEPEKVWLLDDTKKTSLQLIPQVGRGVAGVSLLGEM